jgi:hypothetical protein
MPKTCAGYHQLRNILAAGCAGRVKVARKAATPHAPHDPSGCACTTHGNLKRNCRRFVTSPHLNNLPSSQIIFCVSSADVPEKQADFVLVTAHTFVLWLIPPRLSGSPVQA